MSISVGYAATPDGGRIYYSMESGEGTPWLVIDAPWLWPVDVTLVNPNDLGLFRELGGGRPVYGLDYRGRGRSSAPPGPLTLDGFVEDVAAVARVIGTPFDVFATGMGSQIALAFAARNPACVRRIILHEPVRVERERVVGREWEQVFGSGDPAFLAILFRSFQEEQIDDDVANEIGRLWAPNATWTFLGAVRHAVWDADLVELGRQVTCPVLMCHKQSRLAPLLAMAEEWPEVRVAAEENVRNGEQMGRMYAALIEQHLPLRPDSSPNSTDGGSTPLSPRELQVLALIAGGATNAAIAEALVISHRTAEGHVASILAKLQLRSRGEAAAYAHRHSLTAPLPIQTSAGAER